MDMRLFERFCKQAGTMSIRRIRELADIVHLTDERKDVLRRIDKRGSEIKACPLCGGDKLVKWGTTRTGLLRLRCCKCLRTAL